jgi:hypothetical protein
MDTMYCVDKYSCEVKKVYIEKKTDKSIWISGSRYSICGSYNNYFESFKEAKQFQLDFAEQKVKGSKFSLECAESFLSKVRAQEAN